MKQAMKRSRELLGSGLYCAESVLMVVAESRAVTCEHVPGIATGFCSGLSRTAGPCGALTGAVLAINLVLGRTTPEQSVEPCYRAVRELVERFVGQFGSDNCETLTGCHLGTDHGQARFRDRGVEGRCLEIVAVATRLALEAIAEAVPEHDSG